MISQEVYARAFVHCNSNKSSNIFETYGAWYIYYVCNTYVYTPCPVPPITINRTPYRKNSILVVIDLIVKSLVYVEIDVDFNFWE